MARTTPDRLDPTAPVEPQPDQPDTDNDTKV